jgi:Mce-associated membrane protein
VRSRERRSPVPDAELRDGPEPVTDSPGSADAAKAPTSVAEAEEQVARAELRAQEARAHARRLRQQVEAASGDQPDPTDDTDVDDTTAVADAAAAESGPAKSRRSLRRPQWIRRLRRPSRRTVAVGTAFVLVVVSLGLSGWLLWQHYTLMHDRQRAAEFAAAARRDVAALMSIDPNHARESIQGAIDVTADPLNSQMRVMSPALVQGAQDAKITTKAIVEEAAVASMTDNSATVLVAVRSDTTDPDKTKRPPAVWRMSVNIERHDGQLKLAKVEYVQ